MQTVTKTFNIYEFEELKTEIQQALIENEARGIREIEIDEFLEEFLQNMAVNLLEENFEEKAVFQDVHYSLSYCQGDGAMIEFDLSYCNKNVQIRHNGGMYYHERSFVIKEVDFDKKLTDKQYNQLKNKIIGINEQLTRYGYLFIEEDRTEQAIEQLKDCMFYENGDIY